jgi:hypothetical protein
VTHPRRGIALGVVLIVLTIVAISIVLVIWRARPDESRPPVRFSGARTVIPMPSLLPPARLVEPVRVAVVRDPGAASYYDQPAKLDAIIARWRDAISVTGADVRVVIPAQLEHVSDVQVVPHAPIRSSHARWYT